MELRISESAHFITLTYTPEEVPLVMQHNAYAVMTLKEKHLTNFFKRLRAHISKDKTLAKRWYKQSEKTQKWSPKLRYFACGEYGFKTQRPHYHIIAYNIPNQYIKDNPINNKQYSEILEEIWTHGQIDIGKVEQGSCHYMTKYHMFPLVEPWQENESREPPFARMSRKPGIGNNYADGQTKNYYLNTTNSFATLKNGAKTPLGRYLKTKIYEEGQEQNNARIQATEYARQQEEEETQFFIKKHLGDIDAAYRDQKEHERKNIISATKRFKRQINKNNKL